MNTPRIIATDEAVDLIIRLSMQHGLLVFQLNEMGVLACKKDGTEKISPKDICLGEVAGCLFFLNNSQFKSSRHTQLILDVAKGKEKGLLLEMELGMGFWIRTRTFSAEELEELEEMEEDPELRMFSYVFGYGLQWV